MNREPDYADAIEADPTSPQGLPEATGRGAMDVGSADMPADLEASSAVYWLQAFVKKHEPYKAEFTPVIQRLRTLAVQIESGAPPPPPKPPMPPPPGGPMGAAPPPGAGPPPPPAGGNPLAAALGGAVGRPG